MVNTSTFMTGCSLQIAFKLKIQAVQDDNPNVRAVQDDNPNPPIDEVILHKDKKDLKDSMCYFIVL